MNALISESPVRAVTVQQAVMSVPAFVMNIFDPSIVQPPPSRGRARVRPAAASDPASGSVSPKAASARPAARSGTQRRRCSSSPKSTIGIVPSPVWAATVMATLESTRASSSMAIA